VITGPNGPLLQEILDMYPDAPLIKRNGEVNAWDNEDFRKAVEATGKKQIIVAGITTDVGYISSHSLKVTLTKQQVCVEFVSLSLIQDGYSVYVSPEASGTFNERIAREAIDRIASAGAHIMSNFGIATDLMRDWRNTPGALTLFPYFDKYVNSSAS
jgi:nicotinamidase-related amidase